MPPSVSASATTAPCGLEGGEEVSSGSLHSAAVQPLRGDASAAAATASRAAAISRAAASRAARPSRDPVPSPPSLPPPPPPTSRSSAASRSCAFSRLASSSMRSALCNASLSRATCKGAFRDTFGHSLDACGSRRDT